MPPAPTESSQPAPDVKRWFMRPPVFAALIVAGAAVVSGFILLTLQFGQQLLLGLLAIVLVAVTGSTVWALRRHIGQRVQAETERDRFFNLSLDMLGIVGLDGYFKRVNPAFTRILGYSSAELLKSTYFTYVHPNDVVATRGETRKLSTGEPSIYFENRFRCKDGSYKWLAWAVNPELDEGLMYAVAHDITGRKQAEQALRAESSFRKAMEDSLSTGMRAIDLNRRITYVNPAFCELTGFSEDELIGCVPPYPYWPEKGTEPHQYNLDLTFQGKVEKSGFELMIKRRDDSLIYVLFHVSPLIDSEGRQTGWMAALTDITERLRSREALEAAYERFVAVLEGLDAGVLVSDMESNELLFVNQQFKAPSEASLPDAKVCAIDQSHQQRRRKHGAAFDVEEQDPVSSRWYHIRSRPIKWVDGRTVRMEISTDVTERIEAEELYRQQLERLQSTSRLITMGEMASSLAHELNQPLAAITNYCNGCVTRLQSNNVNVQDLLPVMQKASFQAERAGKIIRRIREFVRTSEPDRSSCEIGEIIEAAVGFAEIDARKHSVEISLQLDEALPHVVADRIMIEQVLVNLVRNAIEAMLETPLNDRTLVVRVRRISREQLEVAVIDRGHGIAPDKREHLFEPFFTTKPHGMGMGLNICRSIIEFHQGQLWVEDNPDGGTIFRFTLPVLA
ncbi:PAS domain S-box protein [Chitinivorax sp. PXF-14]|uniref:PAS domain-containing sensor histidine kinase n=1 Tax=Chitinivorax sp. PXF-14 TaxID=3230488 RepID=UPI0034653326